MSAWIYKQSEPGLWTVGHIEGETWIPESDHASPDAAAARVRWLNGGDVIDETTARVLAENAVGLFLEYRDVHAYGEDEAKRRAIADVVEGATEDLRS